MVAALLLRAPGDESLEVARQEFFATGNETLVTLLDAWDRLSPQLRAWVLPACIAAERNDRCKDRAAERVCKILLGSVAAADTVTIPELLIAIDSVWRLAPLSKTLDEGLLLPCYRHPDPRVRTAAVAAGSESLDWSEMLVNEADAKVRAALAERMGRCGGACVAKGLAMLLRDASWRIRARAAAAHGLLRMGSIGAIDEKISPVWYGALKTSGRLL